MIKIGIYGGSGYMGGELIRILLRHPKAEIVWITSRTPQKAEMIHRNLYEAGLNFIKPEAADPATCDIIFTALPTGLAMDVANKLKGSNTKLIDLGSDFRLKNKETWEDVYKKEHTAADIIESAPYGISEFYRDEIKKAQFVANPGCFSSAAILGVAPLVKNKLVDLEKIVVDGLSGTAGAGAELDQTIHHPEIGNNIVPYNVVFHRHTYEIEQALSNQANQEVKVHFTAYYVPITRGILACCHCFPKEKVTREKVLKLYKEFYQNEYFVKVFDLPKDKQVSWQYRPYPWIAAISGTNFCHVGLDVDEKRGRIVIFSVLDSIGKGGAQVGIQNMNLMFGLDEKTGLESYGSHPY
jgi:N-acetyl-gamma-glutamyl-phosphate reductase common form